MGVIYFVKADMPDGLIKIGWTKSCAKTRLQCLQTGCPVDLSLIGERYGASQKQEGLLHKQLAKHRVRGEWFKDCRQVRQAMLAPLPEYDEYVKPEGYTEYNFKNGLILERFVEYA